jgi:2'-5' RNA ligase
VAITIGIAIAVPEPWGSELRDWRRDLGDPQADRMPTHITLVPPNTVDMTDLATLHDGMRRTAATVMPFDLSLEGIGSFRPVSQVVFVQVQDGEAQCKALEDGLRTHLRVRPRTFPYHPHVTVAMDVAEPLLDEAESALAGYQARWPVEHITMYLRDRAGSWRPEIDVPLG